MQLSFFFLESTLSVLVVVLMVVLVVVLIVVLILVLIVVLIVVLVVVLVVVVVVVVLVRVSEIMSCKQLAIFFSKSSLYLTHTKQNHNTFLPILTKVSFLKKVILTKVKGTLMQFYDSRPPVL